MYFDKFNFRVSKVEIFQEDRKFLEFPTPQPPCLCDLDQWMAESQNLVLDDPNDFFIECGSKSKYFDSNAKFLYLLTLLVCTWVGIVFNLVYKLLRKNSTYYTRPTAPKAPNRAREQESMPQFSSIGRGDPNQDSEDSDHSPLIDRD